MTFGFSESEYSEVEGNNTSMNLRVDKEQKVRLANPVVLRITPLTVERALSTGIISDFHNESVNSPDRAGNKTIVTLPLCTCL